MRRISAWILAIAVVVGVAASAVAYARTSPGLPHATSAPAAATSDVRRQPPSTPSAPRPATKVRWAPCAPGTHLERGTCVREVVHTVVLPAPPAPEAAPAPPARAATPPASAAAPAPAAQPAAAAPAAAPSASTAPPSDDSRHEGEHEAEHEDGAHAGTGGGGHAEHDD